MKNPEMTTLSSGINKTVFTVATDGYSKDAESDFHQITAWRQTAEFVNNYFHKGDMIMVEGKNTSGKYEKEDKTIYTYEVTADRVEFAGSKKESSASTDDNKKSAPAPATTTQPAAAPAAAKTDNVDAPWADLDL